jgi:hypothetical protein
LGKIRFRSNDTPKNYETLHERHLHQDSVGIFVPTWLGRYRSCQRGYGKQYHHSN